MSTPQTNMNVTAIVRKTLSDQPVLCVRSTRTDEMIGEAIGESFQALEHQGLAAAGPPYTVFGEELSPGHQEPKADGWEAGVPVDRAAVPEGHVIPAVLPGGEVASAYFSGNWADVEKVEAVIANLRAQIEAAGLELGGPLRWIWLSDPTVTPDPDNHYTELHWPVRG
ncbi:GyrI-like domain-containing protein [Actinopolymorpha pittospori]|uniref:Effector-binding domain-containing protein n=1 Tax=Actinopolymorpha pittospori TaxID=648752 RepID=A0A927N4U3_9ACTN|nr:GyrI-like domain-containing protein [Actinopolymorpha pittospori]MBE1608560.1 effector-binding domain-containing protein [Actinopolymorpha pittospori]